MYVCMYVCTYVCMYACMYVCRYVRRPTYVSMYVCKYVCMYACMHICMYVCTYVCIFHKKSNDNFYHIKHNRAINYVTSVTCIPRHIFEKNTNIYSCNGQATLLEIFCLSAHVTMPQHAEYDNRSTKTGCRKSSGAHLALRKISAQKTFICCKFVRILNILTPSPLYICRLTVRMRRT